jgi:tetratricopeptide (TPR) repeat protein
MGGKRAGKGKLIFLHTACILAVFLLLTGCASILDFQKRWEGRQRLKEAENLAVRGEYGKALKEYERILKFFPDDSPGDIALFNMGLIWAHPDNPQRDYRRSAMCFQQLVHDFPGSSLTREAGIWLYAIDELASCESRIGAIEKSEEHLKKKLKESQRLIDTLKEIDIGIEEKKREDLPR